MTQRACRICGGSLFGKQRHAVYCSDKCRIKMGNIVKETKRRENGVPKKDYRKITNKGECLWCGDDLDGSPRYQQDEFCSQPCLVSYHEDIGQSWLSDAIFSEHNL